ncbi:YwgA family protein [Anaerobacillus alkaliphilus]|uniref:YwgA family protein n=1 Tax=Anaerobacillus alkaliphilus TaxID=1548597 RepID=A0A4Q0VVU0_9BACI|nr:YwgA family protein [Anaerobacillus alkaliphilus]RXJ02742.1 YwgA family protein [Anaerobacillus alkaliphilus]
MLNDHAKIMALISEAGEVIGRKKLQKIIYIAKKINFPFQERYNFHFYGPYSEELTLRIEEMCNLGFVHETKEKKGGYYQYRYTLSEEGTKFLSISSLNMPKLQDFITDINDKSSRFLELVSTLLFFDDLSAEEQVEKVHTLKGKLNFTEDEIAEAFAYINQLKQITQ